VTLRVPKYLATISVTAEVQNVCADGYSGWFTLNSGIQVGSGSVSGFPSVPARGIAFGSPKAEEMLRVKIGDQRIGGSGIHQSEQSHCLPDVQLVADSLIRLRFQPAYGCSDQK